MDHPRAPNGDRERRKPPPTSSTSTGTLAASLSLSTDEKESRTAEGLNDTQPLRALTMSRYRALFHPAPLIKGLLE